MIDLQHYNETIARLTTSFISEINNINDPDKEINILAWTCIQVIYFNAMRTGKDLDLLIDTLYQEIQERMPLFCNAIHDPLYQALKK